MSSESNRKNKTTSILDGLEQKFKILSCAAIRSGSIDYDLRVLGFKLDFINRKTDKIPLEYFNFRWLT